MNLRKEWKYLNTEIRNSTLEIKDSINKMSNMLDGMISRMKKSLERMNDLDDRIMESNEVEQKREGRIVLGNAVIPSNIKTFKL